MDLGKSLKHIRYSKKLRQKQVCDSLGISKNSLYKIEKGLFEPSPAMMDRLCSFYQVDKWIVYFYALELRDSKNSEELKNVLAGVKQLLKNTYPNF